MLEQRTCGFSDGVCWSEDKIPYSKREEIWFIIIRVRLRSGPGWNPSECLVGSLVCECARCSHVSNYGQIPESSHSSDSVDFSTVQYVKLVSHNWSHQHCNRVQWMLSLSEDGTYPLPLPLLRMSHHNHFERRFWELFAHFWVIVKIVSKNRLNVQIISENSFLVQWLARDLE